MNNMGAGASTHATASPADLRAALVAKYPPMAGLTESQRLGLVLNWAWSAEGRKVWLDDPHTTFEAAPKLGKGAMGFDPKVDGHTVHVWKDPTGKDWGHAFMAAEAEWAKSTPPGANPWGVTEGDVTECVRNGDPAQLIDKLGLGGDVLRGKLDWKETKVLGDPYSVEMYKHVLAFSLYLKISLMLAPEGQKVLRGRLKGEMAPGHGGNFMLTSHGAVHGIFWIPTLWFDLSAVATGRAGSIAAVNRAYFDTLKQSAPGKEILAIESKTPAKMPFRADDYALKLPTKEQWNNEVRPFGKQPWNEHESTEHAHHHDTATALMVVAAARACDSAFQTLVRGIVDGVNQEKAGEGEKIEIAVAPPKGLKRVINKLKGDHSDLADPKVAGNCDTCRNGLTCRPELAHALHTALCSTLDVARVKSGFAVEDASAAYDYRVILTNYSITFPEITHARVAAELRKVFAELYRGDMRGDHPDPNNNFAIACWALPAWLEATHGELPVQLLCETQLILPKYLESRKTSHWPYKFVRAETADELKEDMSNM